MSVTHLVPLPEAETPQSVHAKDIAKIVLSLIDTSCILTANAEDLVTNLLSIREIIASNKELEIDQIMKGRLDDALMNMAMTFRKLSVDTLFANLKTPYN